MRLHEFGNAFLFPCVPVASVGRVFDSISGPPQLWRPVSPHHTCWCIRLLWQSLPACRCSPLWLLHDGCWMNLGDRLGSPQHFSSQLEENDQEDGNGQGTISGSNCFLDSVTGEGLLWLLNYSSFQDEEK